MAWKKSGTTKRMVETPTGAGFRNHRGNRGNRVAPNLDGKSGIHLPYSRPNGSKTYRASIESLTFKTMGELWVNYDLS